jgi:hypothetical protein
LAGIGTGAVGLFSGTGAGGTGASVWDNMKKALGSSITSGGAIDLGGGLVMGPSGNILGGSDNTDSGLSNADIEALINLPPED